MDYSVWGVTNFYEEEKIYTRVYKYIYIYRKGYLVRTRARLGAPTLGNENIQKREIQRRFWFPWPTRFDGSFE